MSTRRGAFGKSRLGAFIKSRLGVRGWNRELIFLTGLPSQSRKRVTDNGSGFDVVWGHDPTATSMSVQHDGGRVMFSLSGGALRCYDTNGSLLWSKASGGPVICVQGGRAWSFDQFSTVRCYDSSDGTLLWETPFAPTGGSNNACWIGDDGRFRFVASVFVTLSGSDEVYENRLYTFDGDGTLTTQLIDSTNYLFDNRAYACRIGNDIVLLDTRWFYTPAIRFDISLIRVRTDGSVAWKNTFGTTLTGYGTTAIPVLAKNGRVYGITTSWDNDGQGSLTQKTLSELGLGSFGSVESIANAPNADLYYYGSSIARIHFESSSAVWLQSQPGYTTHLARLPQGK